MIRTAIACLVVALSLAGAPPASAFSLVSLEPQERDAMLATCKQLPGSEQSLCRDVVNDDNVVANYKRSCLHAMKSMLQGTNWAVVRSLPDAVTCREGLRRAGYPVNTISQRLASALR